MENIDKVRTYQNKSHRELAKISGLSRQTISKVGTWGREKDYSLKLSNAILLSRALNVNFICLFSRSAGDHLDSLGSYVDENYLLIFRKNVDKRLNREFKFEKKSTLSQILNGKVTDPYLSSLTSIAETLGVNDMHQLFEREDVEK